MVGESSKSVWLEGLDCGSIRFSSSYTHTSLTESWTSDLPGTTTPKTVLLPDITPRPPFTTPPSHELKQFDGDAQVMSRFSILSRSLNSPRSRLVGRVA